MTQIRADTALRQLPVRITTVINNRLHDSGPTRSPVIFTIAQYGTRIVHLFIPVCVLITMAYYHRTVRGTNSAPLYSGLRVGSQRHLTINLRSPPRPPMSPVDGRHPPAPPPRCSHHQAELCCMAWIAHATWRPDEASTLISTNRSTPGVPERACGANTALSQSPEHSAGFQCKAIHIAGFGARQFHSSAMSSRM